ncbi:MAG: hypothetical protein ABFE16_06285 [Armatimonadia bacterium]
MSKATLMPVKWQGVDGLNALAGQKVRFRFTLLQGSLCSFWMASDVKGASNGYAAAGGPDFVGARDSGGNEEGSR